MKKLFILVAMMFMISLVSAAVIDDFNDASIDLTKWENHTDVNKYGKVAEESNGQMNLSTRDGSGGSSLAGTANLNNTGDIFDYGGNITFVITRLFSQDQHALSDLSGINITLTDGINQVTINHTRNSAAGAIDLSGDLVIWKRFDNVSWKFLDNPIKSANVNGWGDIKVNFYVRNTAGGGGTAILSMDDAYYNTTDFIYPELIDPANNSESADKELTANVQLDYMNVTNVTFYVWDTGLFNSTVVVADSPTTLNVSTNISNLEPGAYSWNAYACGINLDLETICAWNTANASFFYGYEINSEEYNNLTTEGVIETFTLNITLADGVTLDGADLVYNNTVYSASISETATDTYLLTRTLNIPAVSANVNNTFYWELEFTGATDQTASNIQEVRNIGIDDCSGFGNRILNYTLVDETEQILTSTNNDTINVDVDIYSVGDRSAPIIEFSQNFSGNKATVCLSNLNDYEMDAQAQYSSQGRVVEFYHLQNYTLTNTSTQQNIILYDLKTTESQEFLITFKDENFLRVDNALINIKRKYVGEGVFKTVEIPKTDNQGQAIGHFILSDQVYSISVSKNGQLLAEFDNVVAVCENQATGDCKINLNALSSDDTIDFDTYQGVTYAMSFDRGTRLVTTSFNTLDGSVVRAVLNVTKFDMFGNATVCDDVLSTSAGELSCIIPEGYGNSTVIAEFYVDGNFIDSNVYTLSQTSDEVFGNTRIFLVLLMVLAIPLMFISSPIAIIVGAIIGFVGIIGLNLLDQGSFFGPASTIMWLIIAGGILAWKISQRK